MANVIILGGGISGLSCAYYLSKLGKHVLNKVTLLEKSTSLGGWIASTRFPDGKIYEHGPKSIRVKGRPGFNTLALIDELGLSSDVLQVTIKNVAAQKRMILVNDKLHVLPTSITHLFKKQPPFSKSFISVLFKDFIGKKSSQDVSVHSFATQRFGQEIADLLFDPLCRGIVANDAKNISVKSLFPILFEYAEKYGSVVKGQLKDVSGGEPISDLLERKLAAKAKVDRWIMWSLKNGLQDLPDALVGHLKHQHLVKIETNISCDKLHFVNNQATVHFEGENTTSQIDHVFSAIPAKRMSRLLCSHHTTLAKYLSTITSVNVAVVNLEFKGKVIKEEGFGFLVPSNQDSKVLGITFDSCCFPQHDGKYDDITRITCMMGGFWFEELYGSVDSVSPDLILSDAVEAAQKHLGIQQNPIHHQIHINKNCIPEYKVGHSELLSNINDEISQNNLPLSLLGSSYSGLSVNECIYNAKMAAENYIQSLEK